MVDDEQLLMLRIMLDDKAPPKYSWEMEELVLYRISFELSHVLFRSDLWTDTETNMYVCHHLLHFNLY